MFEQNFGGRYANWLKWFLFLMAIYALSTLWPENRTVVILGGFVAAVGIGIVRYQIKKSRREK
jgi:hypothetical protein